MRVEHPERRAGVVHAGQRQEVRNERDALMQVERLSDHRLGHLIGDHDDGHDGDLEAA